MSDLLNTFHFLRPVWLLALMPMVAVWWLLFRSRNPRIGLSDDIAPHLLQHLVTSPADRPRIRPTTVLMPLGLIAVVALAGPAYRRQPSPFAEDKSQLLLVVEMTPSMLTADLQPSRLERVRNKLHDLLELREGAATGLIAYSGSAHLVMPTTSDSSVIDHMFEALGPAIMPEEGDALAAALDLAGRQSAKEGVAGSILVVADGVEADQLAALRDWRGRIGLSVQILVPLPDEAAFARSGISDAAKALQAKVQRMTPDERDITNLARRADQALVASESEEAMQWRDDGYFLVPVVALGALLWCRRGWSVEL